MRTLLLTLVLGTATGAGAQPLDPAPDLFRYYCSNCHGVDADGEGPLARFLTVDVPDLTGLSARNGGVFPMLEVIHRMDGTREDLLHDSPMPDLNAVLMDEVPGFSDDTAVLMENRARILSIALYLEDLQN